MSLEQLTDPQFSQTYIHSQVTDNMQTLMQFLNEAISGQDPHWLRSRGAKFLYWQAISRRQCDWI